MPIREFKQLIGSRAQVMHGTAKKTGGGLLKKDLMYNAQGKIVSKRASKSAKKSNNLVNAGYVTQKGVFGAVNTQKGGKVKKSKKGRAMQKGGDDDFSEVKLTYIPKKIVNSTGKNYNKQLKSHNYLSSEVLTNQDNTNVYSGELNFKTMSKKNATSITHSMDGMNTAEFKIADFKMEATLKNGSDKITSTYTSCTSKRNELTINNLVRHSVSLNPYFSCKENGLDGKLKRNQSRTNQYFPILLKDEDNSKIFTSGWLVVLHPQLKLSGFRMGRPKYTDLMAYALRLDNIQNFINVAKSDFYTDSPSITASEKINPNIALNNKLFNFISAITGNAFGNNNKYILKKIIELLKETEKITVVGVTKRFNEKINTGIKVLEIKLENIFQNNKGNQNIKERQNNQKKQKYYRNITSQENGEKRLDEFKLKLNNFIENIKDTTFSDKAKNTIMDIMMSVNKYDDKGLELFIFDYCEKFFTIILQSNSNQEKN